MSHNHHFKAVEPRALAFSTMTQVQRVTVTAGSSPVPPSTHSIGVAGAGEESAMPTPTPTAPYQAPVRQQRPSRTQPKHTGTYHAPSRQHRPDHGQSNPVHHTKGHPKLAEKPHKESKPTHHHHSAEHSIPTSKSSAAEGPKDTGTAHSLDQHNGPGNLQKSTGDTTMSGGAKAGLAIGLILAFALIGVLIFLFYRRKKNQNAGHQPLDDEKSNPHKSNGSVSSHVSVRRSVANAPRLSLRPVTDMFPSMTEKQEHASASTMIANSAASARTKTAEPSNRQARSNDQMPSDPFADNAETPTESDSNTLPAPGAVVPKPLSIKSERTGDSNSALPNVDQSAVVSGPTSNNKRLSPPGLGPNNVHRVQLDFNPSMDDELGLRAGQLVRMLHEYDDGWALCIRLDRSQQGVVPRTCISKLPVKPRPQGPPPGARGPPQGRPRGASNGPAAARGSPQDVRQRVAAPQSGRLRSQSSGPQHVSPATAVHLASGELSRRNVDPIPERETTSSDVDASESPSASPTQSGAVLNRKPVPGQALSC